MVVHCRWLRLLPAVLLTLLTFTRQAGAQVPSLTLSLSPGGTPVTFIRKEPDVVVAFTLDSSNAQETADVNLRLIPFVDEQGSPAESASLVINNQPAGSQVFSVPALGHVPVQVKARLPRAGGTYTAYLILSQGGKSGNPVTLTIQRPAATVTVRDIAPLQAEQGQAVVPVTIQETTGQKVDIGPLRLVGLTRDTGDPVKLGSTANWTVLTSPSSDTEQKEPLGIMGLDTLGIRIQNLESPGKYEGTVIVPYGSPADHTVEKGLTIYVQESLWTALLWIFIGVAVSYLIREYLNKTRPRLIVLRRIEAAAIRLDDILKESDLDIDERELTSALRRHLTDVNARLSLGSISVVDASSVLDAFEFRLVLLRDWLNLYRKSIKGNPTPDVKIVAGLNEVSVVLRDEQATSQEIQDADKKLDALVTIINVGAKGMVAARMVQAQPESRARATFKKINLWIRTSDFLVSLVILLIACLLGLKTLWLNDLSWGGLGDHMIALLWGLGLHQATFAGVEALRMTLAK
jgi:hypothetical protein